MRTWKIYIYIGKLQHLKYYIVEYDLRIYINKMINMFINEITIIYY